MIEIISMEEKSDKELGWRPLPKNVRQVGECRGPVKIYIEDYVITYLKKLSNPNQVQARGAILFGRKYETEEGEALFICGAIEAQNLELDMDDTFFDQEIWDDLKKKGEIYYPEQVVVGWFLSRIGFSVEVNQKIIEMHKDYFFGDDTVLYLIDGIEKEDAFYLWDKKSLRRQRGYYIYYEKNTAMQEYMMTLSKGPKSETEEQAKRSELRRDKKVLNSYRKRAQYSKKSRKRTGTIRLIRAACVLLIVTMTLLSIWQVNERFKTGENGNRVVETFLGMKDRFVAAKQNVPVYEEILPMEESPVTEATIGEVIQSTEEIKETLGNGKPLYYIVQKGDTLAAISRKMYSSDRYTKQIASANDLTNADQIYEGQKILIPSIE